MDPSLEPTAGSRSIEALWEQLRWRWHHRHNRLNELVHIHPPIPPERHNILRELNHSQINFGNGSVSQGEAGNVVAETSRCLFECNICFELAKDPVVTSCGHLFCWPCIFQWLDEHSIHKDCPVCKGRVVLESIIPIYGRGSNAHVIEQEGSDPKIPPRPKARRLNPRQNLLINALALPGEETLQLHGNINSLTQHLVQPHEPHHSHHEQAEITTSLLRNPRTHQDMRIEQNRVATQLNSMAWRLGDIGRGGRNHERPSSADGRGSFSSNVAYINSLTQHSVQAHEPDNSHHEQAEITMSLLRNLRTHMLNEQNRVVTQLNSTALRLGDIGRGGRNQERPSSADGRGSISSIVAYINSLTQHSVQPHEPDNSHHEQAEITTSLLRNLRTHQDMRNEQNRVATQINSMAWRLGDIGRGGRNHERPSSADGTGSFSSIGAYITESGLNSALERNSMASLSASSSRRGNDSSRVYDVDNRDYEARRRRRLN